MKITKWVALTASVAAAGSMLTGCGDDSSASAGSFNDSSAKGAPIVIGTVGSYSGAQSAALGKSSVGIEAWTNQVNKDGGLNGHPVKLIVKDDGGDPAKALQAAKELIEKEKVVAIVGETSVADEAFQKYVEGKKVPVVGGLAPEKPFLTSPDFFPSGSSLVVTTYGMIKDAKEAGAKTVGGLYCAESPVCAQAGALGDTFSKMLGVTWTDGKISATQPNYTASCLSMKNAGAEGLYIAHNGAVAVRAVADCVKAGFEPVAMAQLNSVGADVIASPQYDGAVLTASNAVFTDEDVPGVKEFREAVEAYQPGITKDKQFTIGVEQAWAGGKLFEAAAEAAGLGPESTPSDVYEGLYALKEETLGGLSAPLTFSKGKPSFPSCYFSGSIEDGALVSKSAEPTCLSPEELAAMGKILAAMS